MMVLLLLLLSHEIFHGISNGFENERVVEHKAPHFELPCGFRAPFVIISLWFECCALVIFLILHLHLSLSLWMCVLACVRVPLYRRHRRHFTCNGKRRILFVRNAQTLVMKVETVAAMFFFFGSFSFSSGHFPHNLQCRSFVPGWLDFFDEIYLNDL